MDMKKNSSANSPTVQGWQVPDKYCPTPQLPPHDVVTAQAIMAKNNKTI
jgi:hypothetical protein